VPSLSLEPFHLTFHPQIGILFPDAGSPLRVFSTTHVPSILSSSSLRCPGPLMYSSPSVSPPKSPFRIFPGQIEALFSCFLLDGCISSLPFQYFSPLRIFFRALHDSEYSSRFLRLSAFFPPFRRSPQQLSFTSPLVTIAYILQTPLYDCG